LNGFVEYNQMAPGAKPAQADRCAAPHRTFTWPSLEQASSEGKLRNVVHSGGERRLFAHPVLATLFPRVNSGSGPDFSRTVLCGINADAGIAWHWRRWGHTATSLPRKENRPSVGPSTPANTRSVVVLPQPDGPSITKTHRLNHEAKVLAVHARPA